MKERSRAVSVQYGSLSESIASKPNSDAGIISGPNRVVKCPAPRFWSSHKLALGVGIRICSLDGVEWILMRHRGDHSLVISVELLQRSVPIRVEGYDDELS